MPLLVTYSTGAVSGKWMGGTAVIADEQRADGEDDRGGCGTAPRGGEIGRHGRLLAFCGDGADLARTPVCNGQRESHVRASERFKHGVAMFEIAVASVVGSSEALGSWFAGGRPRSR